MSGATLGRPLVSLLARSTFNQTFASHREAFDPWFPRIHLGLDPTEVRERPGLLGHARRRIFSWDRQCRNYSTSAPSNCILIFECLDEPFSYGSCNLCIGVIAIPRASCRRRRSECSVRLPVYPMNRDMSQTPETTYSNAELFKRMQDMHRSWIERLREIRQIESDFGNRLLNARNPTEVTMVCAE